MISISVCMIVKNEEKVLARCLDSIKDLVDEIIIVDTGSVDNTKKIAAEYTDKIYDFPWIDDFSAARNFSFSLATKDYIYAADADEVLDETNRQRFLLLKQNLLPEIEIVQMMYDNQLLFNTTYNFNLEYRPKLYKRLRTFHWVEPVHENVVLQPIIYDSDIVIQHLPISNHAGLDFRIYKKTIKEEGKLSGRLYQMYARELFIAGGDDDFLEAMDYFQNFADLEECSERERKIYECILVKCYFIKKDIARLMKYSLHNIADGKGSSEVCYLLGEYFKEIRDYKEATIWFYNAAYETECELNIHYGGDYPLQQLAECYYKLGNMEQGDAFTDLAKDWKQ